MAYRLPSRPAHRDAVAGAHVGDDTVADRQVEVGREASRGPACRGHDPQPVEQTGLVAVERGVRDEIATGRPDRGQDVVAGGDLLEVAAEVDGVHVRLAVEVAILIGVADDRQPGAVRRPVEAADVPRAVRQLRRLPAIGRHDEDVLVPAVAIADAVVLVIERARDSHHGRAPHLVAAFRGTRVVHHAVRIGHHGAEERDVSAVRRPDGRADALRKRGQLPRPAALEVEHEDLVGGAPLADESKPAAVGRPLRTVIVALPDACLDRLGVEHPAHHDAALVAARLGVRPPQLVRDVLAVRAQADVVQPAEPVDVFGS